MNIFPEPPAFRCFGRLAPETNDHSLLEQDTIIERDETQNHEDMLITNSSKTTTSTDGRFRRIEIMLGMEACERLRESRVMVVGLGAVGSYAVEGLARAGVGNLKVIDFDKVSVTNINRQLYAMESTIGLLKSDVARERILDINPSCNVEAIEGFVDADSIREYLVDPPDLVVDAIDSLNPKVELISAVLEREIPLITCLGAATRFDPTAVRIGPLADAHGCHLGSAVRKRLRRRNIPVDHLCVYSVEPVPHPLPKMSPAERLNEETSLERGRTRDILGSLPTITGIFGLTAANLAVQMLIGRR